VPLASIWLKGGDHFFIRAANATFKGECNGVLDVKITNQ
jgi:hypothetical protein